MAEMIVYVSYLLKTWGGYKLFVTPPQFDGGLYTVTAEGGGISLSASDKMLDIAQGKAVAKLASYLKEARERSTADEDVRSVEVRQNPSRGLAPQPEPQIPVPYNQGRTGGGSARGGKPRGNFVVSPPFTKDKNLFTQNNKYLKEAGFRFWSADNGGDKKWYGDNIGALPAHLQAIVVPLNEGAEAIQSGALRAQQAPQQAQGYDVVGSSDNYDDIPF